MISGVSSAFVEGISAAIESDAIESVVRVGAAVVHESVSGSREEEKEDGACYRRSSWGNKSSSFIRICCHHSYSKGGVLIPQK